MRPIALKVPRQMDFIIKNYGSKMSHFHTRNWLRQQSVKKLFNFFLFDGDNVIININRDW